MVDLINLRQIRKQRQRQDKQRRAEQNRVTFGQSKSSKTSDAQRRHQIQQELDGKKLETGPAEPPDDPDRG